MACGTLKRPLLTCLGWQKELSARYYAGIERPSTLDHDLALVVLGSKQIGFCLGNLMSSYCYVFHFFHIQWTPFCIHWELNVLNYLYVYINIIHLLPILANGSIKYQRACDTWQATTKMSQPCNFLTKSHECMVKCANYSRNCSEHAFFSPIVINVW